MKGNTSGIKPVEFNVVVRPRPVEATIRTKSGFELIKPIETVESEQNAAVVGELVAVSPHAFSYEDWPKNEPPPKPGATVLYAKYSGMKHTGRDGVDYVILKDKDVAAVLEA